MTPQIRLFAACALVSAWMILLFTGFVLGGWTHLVLGLALYLFPWRAASRNGAGGPSADPVLEAEPRRIVDDEQDLEDEDGPEDGERAG